VGAQTWSTRELDVLLAAYGRPDADLARELGRTVSAVRFLRRALHGLHQRGSRHSTLLVGPLRQHVATQRGQRQCPVCGAVF
jgi:DNA-binding CsgD family transcriptional regulator